MDFATPVYGLVALGLFLLLELRLHRVAEPVLTYPGLEDFRTSPMGLRVLARRALPWVRRFAILLLVLALARPRAGKTVEVVKAQGIDIVIALDVSGSMAKGRDLKPNRLEVAKQVIDHFVAGRAHDRIGLVVFAGAAFTRVPLTLDYAILRQMLAAVVDGMVATDGTAIGMGLATAVSRLRGSTAKSKVVVLLTDGVNNAGSVSPEAAAKLAKEQGIKVHTIGVGAPGGSGLGRLGLFQLGQVPELDEPLLRKLAELTGGRYFRAVDNDTLAGIFQVIDRLEKSEVESQTFTRWRELFPGLVGLGALLLALELAAAATFLRTVP